MNALRTVLKWFAFPGILFGCMTGFFVGAAAGAPLTTLALGTVVIAFALVAVTERLIPERDPELNVRRARTDLLHSLVGSHGGSSLARALVLTSGAVAAGWLSTRLGGGLWPHRWPLPLQLLLGLTLGEFGSYWIHRLCHASPLWWRIHAIHHSPETLYVLAAGRNHPIQAFLSYGAQTLPLVLLGASPTVIVAAAAFTGVLGFLQHTNADLRSGALRYVFATTELHKTHHSWEVDDSNHNFGNNMILWDLLFGTFRAAPTPARYGVPGVAWPEGWWAQLATPFTYARLLEPPASSDARGAPSVEEESRSLAGVGGSRA